MTLPIVEYSNNTLSVIPCNGKTKAPTIPWKEFQERIATKADIRSWRNYDSVAIICGKASGNLECIDFDQEAELFDEWKEKVDPELFSKLVVQSTQSGGKHVVYRHLSVSCSKNMKLASREGKVLIETRGEGGYFLAAPSPGYSLEQGSFLNVLLIGDDERESLLLAAWSLREKTEFVSTDYDLPSDDSKRPGDEFNQRGEIVPVLRSHGWRSHGKAGDDNQKWTRPGKKYGTSATLKDRVFYVFTSSTEFGQGPQSPFAVYTTLEHGGDFEAAARQLAADGYGSDLEPSDNGVDLSEFSMTSEEPIEPGPEDPGIIPESMFEVPGLIGQIMAYTLSHAPTRNPAMAFAGALAMQSFLCGRKVKDSFGNRSNLYILGLASSGSGKDFPRQVNKRILSEIDAGSASVSRFGSAEGIEDKLIAIPSILVQTDELDGFIASGANSRDGRHDAIIDRLKELYTSSNQTYTTRQLAGKDSLNIDGPSVTMLGSAVPQHFYGAMSVKMLTDGFFSRMLCIESPDQVTDQDPIDDELPEEIVRVAKWWYKCNPGGGNLDTDPVKIEITPVAREIMKTLVLDARAKQNGSSDEVRAAIWSRVRQMTHKLALIYACSANHVSPQIDVDAMTWAQGLAKHQAARMLYMADIYVSDGQFHGQCQKVIRLLKRNKGKCSRSTALMNLHINSREMDEIERTLAESRIILVSKAKPKTYRLQR